ncbi:MAG: hypothetical protein RIE31_00630 [Alphaproteobacteria bacterium]
MRRLTIFFSALALFGLVSPPPASASEAGIARVTQALHIASGGLLTDSANISTGAAPDVYVISFADVRHFFNDGAGIELGPVTGEARIIDDHTITIRIDLPQRILFYDGVTAEPDVITAQRARLEFSFDEDLGLARSMRLAVNGMDLEFAPFQIAVADLTYTYDLQPVRNGSGREDMRFAIRGVQARAPDAGATFSLAAMETSYQADAVPLAKMATMQAALADAERRSRASGHPAGLADSAQARAAVAAYVAAIGEHLDNGQWEFSLQGLRYADSSTGEAYSSDRTRLSGAVHNGQSESPVLSFTLLDLSRYVPGDGAGGPGAALPQGLNAPRTDVALTLQPFPLRDWTRIIADTLSASPDPVFDAMALREMGPLLTASLVGAGSQLSFDRASITAGPLATSLAGALTVSGSGEMGLVGELVWRTTGAVQALQALTALPGHDQVSGGLALGLQQIIAAGRPDSGGHAFTITLPPVGPPTFDPPLLGD